MSILENEENLELPINYPLLPIRDLVIFPYMVFPMLKKLLREMTDIYSLHSRRIRK